MTEAVFHSWITYSNNNWLPAHKEARSASIIIIRSKRGIMSTRDLNASLLLMPPLCEALNSIVRRLNTDKFHYREHPIFVKISSAYNNDLSNSAWRMAELNLGF